MLCAYFTSVMQVSSGFFQDEASIKAKDNELAKIHGNFEKLQKQSNKDAEGYAAAQKHFHAVSAGLSSNQDGDDASLNEQLLGAPSFSLWSIFDFLFFTLPATDFKSTPVFCDVVYHSSCEERNQQL